MDFFKNNKGKKSGRKHSHDDDVDDGDEDVKVDFLRNYVSQVIS